MHGDIEINLIKCFQHIPCSTYITKIMKSISAIFNYKIYIFIILILYFFNKLTNLQLIILSSSQFIIFAIKYIFKRKRPYMVSKDIKLLESDYFDEYSFPSGHTLNACLLSYFLKKNLNINLNVLAYLVGLSRVYLGVHYPSDIIGGILLTKIILYFNYL